MRRPSEATQAYCKNMPVATFVQNDISLLLERFANILKKPRQHCQNTVYLRDEHQSGSVVCLEYYGSSEMKYPNKKL